MAGCPASSRGFRSVSWHDPRYTGVGMDLNASVAGLVPWDGREAARESRVWPRRGSRPPSFLPSVFGRDRPSAPFAVRIAPAGWPGTARWVWRVVPCGAWVACSLRPRLFSVAFCAVDDRVGRWRGGRGGRRRARVAAAWAVALSVALRCGGCLAVGIVVVSWSGVPRGRDGPVSRPVRRSRTGSHRIHLCARPHTFGPFSSGPDPFHPPIHDRSETNP